MDSITEAFKLDISEKIENLVFSPSIYFLERLNLIYFLDGKYFATCGEINNIIFIWDFDLILNKKNSFDPSGNQNISNFALSHKAKVLDFFFRGFPIIPFFFFKKTKKILFFFFKKKTKNFEIFKKLQKIILFYKKPLTDIVILPTL